MKKIKLEVVVEDKDAIETLTFLQRLIANNTAFLDNATLYVLCMEDCDG